MEKFDYNEFNKRYDKFKKNNLLTPFYDNERLMNMFIFVIIK